MMTGLQSRLNEKRGSRQPDLSGERFIVSRFSPGPDLYEIIVQRAAKYDIRPSISYKEVAQETLLDLVGLGQGITITSSSRAAVSIPDLVFLPMNDPADIMSFIGIWAMESDNPALRRLLSMARTMSDIGAT